MLDLNRVKWHDVTYLFDNPRYQYEITINGDARGTHLTTGKIKYSKIVPGKYTVIGGKHLHRIMIIHFKGKIEKGKVVRHLNDLRHDNRLCNLKIGTYADNRNDASKNNPDYNKNISIATRAAMNNPELRKKLGIASAAARLGKKRGPYTSEHIAAIQEGKRRAKALREAQKSPSSSS